jgi:hypothetical protein
MQMPLPDLEQLRTDARWQALSAAAASLLEVLRAGAMLHAAQAGKA